MKLPSTSIASALLSLLVAGCVSTPYYFKYESASFADKFQLHGCWISTQLTSAEVIKAANIGGNPGIETDSDWTKLANDLRDGDQLRLVNCGGVAEHGGAVYFALIRDNEILHRFYPMILD